MARKVRDANLTTPRTRLKLKALKRHWQGIQEGRALGYRRGRRGGGAWSVRVLLPDGRYALRAIGDADDHSPADGKSVFNLAQAHARAVAVADQMNRLTPATVAEAAQKYLAWFTARPTNVRASKIGQSNSNRIFSALAVLNDAFQDGAG